MVVAEVEGCRVTDSDNYQSCVHLQFFFFLISSGRLLLKVQQHMQGVMMCCTTYSKETIGNNSQNLALSYRADVLELTNSIAGYFYCQRERERGGLFHYHSPPPSPPPLDFHIHNSNCSYCLVTFSFLHTLTFKNRVIFHFPKL